MKERTLSKAFTEYMNKLTLGLMSLAEHFQGGDISIKREWEDEENEAHLQALEILKDGEVIYRNDEGKGRDMFEGMMIKIVEQEKAANFGENHQGCKVCVYILSCIEDQLNAMDVLAEELKRARSAARMPSSIVEMISSLMADHGKPPEEQSVSSRKIFRRAALAKSYCREKGWPNSPFELNAEQHEEMAEYVEQKIREEFGGEDNGEEPSGPPSHISEAELESLRACQSEEEWEQICNSIKEVRGGEYPLDWFPKVMASGLAKEVLARFGQAPGFRLETINKEGKREVVFDGTKAEGGEA